MALDDVIFGPWAEAVHDIPVHAPFAGILTDVVFDIGRGNVGIDVVDDIPVHAAYLGVLTEVVYDSAYGYKSTTHLVVDYVMHVNPRFLTPAVNPFLVIRPL